MRSSPAEAVRSGGLAALSSIILCFSANVSAARLFENVATTRPLLLPSLTSNLDPTALQFGLDRAGALSETMATSNAALAGVVLIVAGAYQWTPLKQARLR